MPWIKLLRIMLFMVGVANIAIYFVASGLHILLAIGVLLVCGGGVVVGYVEDPASFHQPVKLFRRRRRN